MTSIVRTHTYYMSFREYNNKFLKQQQKNIALNINNNVLTRTHIIFK